MKRPWIVTESMINCFWLIFYLSFLQHSPLGHQVAHFFLFCSLKSFIYLFFSGPQPPFLIKWMQSYSKAHLFDSVTVCSSDSCIQSLYLSVFRFAEHFETVYSMLHDGVLHRLSAMHTKPLVALYLVMRCLMFDWNCPGHPKLTHFIKLENKLKQMYNIVGMFVTFSGSFTLSSGIKESRTSRNAV